MTRRKSDNTRTARTGRTETTHLYCNQCESNATIARIRSKAQIVCHCTHIDGTIRPRNLNHMANLPDEWEFVEQGGADE